MASSLFQKYVTHGYFEPKGRDDADNHFAELFKTKNPIPILLVFYYKMVEILLALNYRPDIQRTVLYYQKI